MTRTKRILVVAAVGAALAGAGCGSDSEDFITDYNKATAPLATLTTDLSGGVSGGRDGTAQAERSLTRVADELDSVEGRLRALKPPSGAQDEFDALLGALRGNTTLTRQMVDTLGKGDVDGLAARTQQLADRGAALVRAEQALRAAVAG
jgi:hypothetical protein